MDNQPIALTDEKIICDACQTTVSTDDAFCNTCGYPLKGTEQEQRNFIAQLTVNEIELADLKAQIKKGGNSLYYVAGAWALGALLSAFTVENDENLPAILIASLIICGIFVFLGSYARKKPFAALVSGMALYAIITILLAIVEPLTIVQGIIFKIIIIVCLVNGLKAAIKAEKIKKETHLQ